MLVGTDGLYQFVDLFYSNVKSNVNNELLSTITNFSGNLLSPYYSPVVSNINIYNIGKSTLVGNLLYKCGLVNQASVRKNQKEAGDAGKGSFAMAWMTDESQSERERGVTIDTSEKYFKSPNSSREYTILDAPGHREFVPNMISGATVSDAAFFVIPAKEGEYETAVSKKSQTREHAVLMKALGVKYVIIAVNKLDDISIEPSQVQSRYNKINDDIRSMLLELQFKEEFIYSVPVIGISGENIISISSDCTRLSSWYRGPTLVQVLDSLPSEAREVRKPLRALLTSVHSENAKVQHI